MALSNKARARIFLESARMVYWDQDAQAYFARAGLLSGSAQNRINDLLIGIKRALGLRSLSDRFDAMWILANETATAARQNVVKNDHHCSTVNTLTFTPFQGYAGNGSDSYLNTDYIPSTDAVRVAQDAHHLSVASLTTRAGTASMFSIGARQTAPSAREMSIAPNSAGSAFLRTADAANSISRKSDTRAVYVAVRSASNATQRYFNAVAQTSGSDNSVGLPNVAAFIGARNAAGTPDQFSTDITAFASFGGTMTASEVSAFTVAIERYLDSLGVGVV